MTPRRGWWLSYGEREYWSMDQLWGYWGACLTTIFLGSNLSVLSLTLGFSLKSGKLILLGALLVLLVYVTIQAMKSIRVLISIEQTALEAADFLDQVNSGTYYGEWRGDPAVKAREEEERRMLEDEDEDDFPWWSDRD